jgi:hypothetical protein
MSDELETASSACLDSMTFSTPHALGSTHHFPHVTPHTSVTSVGVAVSATVRLFQTVLYEIRQALREEISEVL